MDPVSYRTLVAFNREMKKLDDIYRSAAKECGMAECAFWILYTLRVEEKSFTQAELCEFLAEPKQTVNSALKKLVAEGYLALSSGADQRSKLVQLTPKGEQLALRARRPHPGGGGCRPARDVARTTARPFICLTRQYRLLLRAAAQNAIKVTRRNAARPGGRSK